MAVDERRRKALYEALEREIGAEAADTMMELLPPVGWADVATKEDLRQLELRMSAKMDGLRAELRGEMAELRGELRGEMAELRGELRAGMERGFRRMTQWNVGVLLGGLAAVAAIVRIL